MQKIAVLIEDQYHVVEAWYPYLRLKEAGFETVFVGPGTHPEYQSKKGYPAKEEASIHNVETRDFSGVIIPGGFAPDKLRRSEKITGFVRQMDQQQKLVAAICHAGWVLVSAGILEGRKATCFSAIKDDLVNAGAEYCDAEVVVDNNLITARKPADLPAFCREIIRFLEQTG